MNKTEHYQLNKPEQDDFYNIVDMNENMDIIENAMLEFENFHHGQMVTIDTDWNNIEPGMHAVNGGSDKSKTWSKELNGPNGARLIGVLLCIGDTASKNFTQIYNEGFVSGIASRRTIIRTCIDGVYGGWMIMASVTDVSAAVAKIVADAPADFDTLKEMSDWISKHQSDASAMNSAIQQNAENIENMTAEMTAVKKSVSDGKTLVAKAITDKGKATAADASFQTMSDNVRLMAGVQYGYGVTAADNRANPNSTNYKTGYNAGVTAADARVNTASANYKAGYSAGAAAKKSFTLQLKPEQDSSGNWAVYAYVNGVRKDGWWVGETSNLPKMNTDIDTYYI